MCVANAQSFVTTLLNTPPRLLAGAVYIVDEHTKLLVEALQARGMYDNSIIVVTSDNGGNPSAGGNNYPLKGTKKTLFEGG